MTSRRAVDPLRGLKSAIAWRLPAQGSDQLVDLVGDLLDLGLLVARVTKCGKLTERFRYSAESVFDTFPWPQSPDPAKVLAVAEAGREVRRIRAESLPKLKGGLRALYRTLELPGANPLKTAHAALDAAVLAAYGFSAKSDLLAQILALNESVAGSIEAGQPVTAPGVPEGYSDPASLVTDDCIRAASE